jgi:DNA-binding transcriptional regulator YiaG
MEQFTAKDARQLSNVLDEQELSKIIEQIKEFAEQGHAQLPVHNPIKPATIFELRERGFEVTDVELARPISSTTFHVISW